MNKPDLLILDEPTKGFDPVNRRLLMGIIEDQKKADMTVLMVTHQMEEVERLCDRVIMLKNGRAEAYGTISEIQDRFGGRTVRLRYAGQLPATSPYWEPTLVDRNYAELSLGDDADEAAVLRDLVETGIAVSSFTTTKKSMDEIRDDLRRPRPTSRTRRDRAGGGELMATHNLGTVIGFEFGRTLKKKSFWIITLAVPVVIAIIFALVFVSSSSADQNVKDQANASIRFLYTDPSGLITPTQAQRLGGAPTTDPGQAVADVQAGRVQAYFACPADPATQTVRVYGQDEGIFKNGQYQAVAELLLTTAVTEKIGSPKLSALAGGGATFESTTYRDGSRAAG